MCCSRQVKQAMSQRDKTLFRRGLTICTAVNGDSCRTTAPTAAVITATMLTTNYIHIAHVRKSLKPENATMQQLPPRQNPFLQAG